MRHRKIATIALVAAALMCAVTSRGNADKVPDEVFAEFKSRIEQALVGNFGGDPKRNAYQFVFAVETGGNYSAQMAAARDIIYQCLDGGLLRDDDRVGFIAFELSTWREYWYDDPFQLRQGTDIARSIAVEQMPEAEWKEIENERTSVGGTGGHDVDSALHAALSHLAETGYADKCIIIVMQGSNLLYECPRLPESAGPSLRGNYLFRRFCPEQYEELIAIATRSGFDVDSVGLSSDVYFKLTIPDATAPSGRFGLHVWCYAPRSIKPISERVGRGRVPFELAVVSSETNEKIPNARAQIDGNSVRLELIPDVPRLLEPGHYTLEVRAPGHAAAKGISVDIPPNVPTQRLTVQLDPRRAYWLLLLLALPLFIRWRVRVENEGRRVIDLPLIWPGSWYVCARLEDEPKSNEFLLSGDYGSEVNEGRLVTIRSVLLPFAKPKTRLGRQKLILGRNFVHIGDADNPVLELELRAVPAIGLRFGIVRVNDGLQDLVPDGDSGDSGTVWPC